MLMAVNGMGTTLLMFFIGRARGVMVITCKNVCTENLMILERNKYAVYQITYPVVLLRSSRLLHSSTSLQRASYPRYFSFLHI